MVRPPEHGYLMLPWAAVRPARGSGEIIMNEQFSFRLDREGTPAGLRRSLELAEAASVPGVLILACEGNGFTPADIDPLLETSGVPFFGGIFPRIIHGDELLERGSLVIGLPDPPRIIFLPDISDREADFEAQLDQLLTDTFRDRTMMVFVDGFAQRISAFIEALFNVFGLELNYIGGGAGSLGMKQSPCLITGDGLKADGAVLALLETASGVGVAHGWDAWIGPFRVTESDHNVIRSLEWRPAFDVYREAVSQHAGRSFTAAEFFEVAKAYPFGIARMGNEQIVRDPLSVGADGELYCVGEVPEGSFVSILHGDEQSLLRAAGRALELGKAALPAGRLEGRRIAMDCISRALFLDRHFGRELAVLNEGHVGLVGACTIGEIANCGDEYLEFYNKTAVVGVLEQR